MVSDTYTLIVDRRTHKILELLSRLLVKPENDEVLDDLYYKGQMPALTDLVMSMEAGKHEAGWCADPDCKFKSESREELAKQIKALSEEI